MLKFKKFIVCFILIVLSFQLNVFAAHIVAFVNDDVVTDYDFQERKKLLMLINNIENPDHATAAQINKAVLDN